MTKEKIRVAAATILNELAALANGEYHDIMGLGVGAASLYYEYFSEADTRPQDIAEMCQCIIDDKPYVAPEPAAP